MRSNFIVGTFGGGVSEGIDGFVGVLMGVSMTAIRFFASYLGASVFLMIISFSAAHSAYADSNFCSRLPTFCKLPPADYGFWLVCLFSFFLLNSCVGLMRFFVVSLMRADRLDALEKLRLKCEICITIVCGLGLLFLLSIGFVAATYPGA